MYYDQKEITPELEGVFRFNKADEPVSRFTSREVEVRALVEGQFVAKRVHAENLGFSIGMFIWIYFVFMCWFVYGVVCVLVKDALIASGIFLDDYIIEIPSMS